MQLKNLSFVLWIAPNVLNVNSENLCNFPPGETFFSKNKKNGSKIELFIKGISMLCTIRISGTQRFISQNNIEYFGFYITKNCISAKNYKKKIDKQQTFTYNIMLRDTQDALVKNSRYLLCYFFLFIYFYSIIINHSLDHKGKELNFCFTFGKAHSRST